MAEALNWIAADGRHELLVRKSRFLALIMSCASAAEARDQLARIRGEHPKASHHVFAWRLRAVEDGQITHRCDDDGEPGGTAGRPTLMVLEGQSVINVQAVVVRYFGGIKLGAGGLVRAYGEAAGKALVAAELRPLVLTKCLSVRVPFSQVSILERIILREGVQVEERMYDEEVRMNLVVVADLADELMRELTDLTGGAAQIEVR